MGLITSRDQTMLDGPVGTTKSNHVRQPSTRNRTKPPMPDRDELENRFIKVLVCKNNFTGTFVYKHANIVYDECDILTNASQYFLFILKYSILVTLVIIEMSRSNFIRIDTSFVVLESFDVLFTLH